MLSVNVKTPQDFRLSIAEKAKKQRLLLNLTQAELAIRSGVSLGSIKRFEQNGLISLKSLLELALVLEKMEGFEHLFSQNDLPASLNDLNVKKRLRGRKKNHYDR
jgi:transcriptional regulator with XRE-family HTH domain